tara:strand:- start:17203 stop:17316 length:114 start_codon:yes stop_codon:yes gene_type:complete
LVSPGITVFNFGNTGKSTKRATKKEGGYFIAWIQKAD